VYILSLYTHTCTYMYKGSNDLSDKSYLSLIWHLIHIIYFLSLYSFMQHFPQLMSNLFLAKYTISHVQTQILSLNLLWEIILIYSLNLKWNLPGTVRKSHCSSKGTVFKILGLLEKQSYYLNRIQKSVLMFLLWIARSSGLEQFVI
jgi:hypothetical protein